MNKPGWWNTYRQQGKLDTLSVHRDPILYPFSVISTVSLLPFVISNLLAERILLGVCGLIVTLILAINAWNLYQNRKPPIPFAILLIPSAATIVVSLSRHDIYGALWTYPLMTFCYFIQPWRTANLCALVLLIGVSEMVYLFIGAGTAFRFFVSLALNILIINIILKVINDLQQQLVAQAITDPLTGAFNRRHMESCLSDAIERNRRTGAPASLIILDIDHFKQINDRFGHETGDRVLKAIVALLNTHSRKLDLLFRMGGEEFMLLLPDMRQDKAMTVAEHLRALIAQSDLTGDSQRAAISVSIGISELLPGESRDTWIRRADDALYRAKKSGRNQVACETLAQSAVG